MNALQRIWQKLLPHRILALIGLVFESNGLKERRTKVLNHFKTVDPNSLEPEILEGLDYLKSHKFASFPYNWTKKYDKFFPEVFRDTDHQRFYVYFEGKRMYFPKSITNKQVIWAMRLIYREQDSKSPHLYLTPDFQIEPNSIVVDAGVAEGNFALSVVEMAKHLFLIECDKEWMEALKITFAPWKEKVTFVEKYMSDCDDESTTSIDGLFKPEADEKYFIKMDIEGFEQKALAGMKNLAASGKSIKMDVCTYHQPEALQEIEVFLKDYGFHYQVSDGFVLFFQNGEEPSFRKVLVRAERTTIN